MLSLHKSFDFSIPSCKIDILAFIFNDDRLHKSPNSFNCLLNRSFSSCNSVIYKKKTKLNIYPEKKLKFDKTQQEINTKTKNI